MRRLLKQIFYGAIYLGIFAGIIYVVIFRVFFPPSCTDKIKNQGEEGVDCGGPCISCEVRQLAAPVARKVAFFPNPEKNTVDLAAEVKNLNAAWGVNNLSWQFILKGDDGNVLSRVRGSTHLLPGETRWIIAPAAYPPGRVANVDFEIQQTDISWQKLKPFTQDVLLRVLDPSLKKLVPPVAGFAELRGFVRNQSSFAFEKVEVNAVLFDGFERVIAVGQTTLEKLGPGETSPFLITWPTRFSAEMNRFEVHAHTNLLSDANFLWQYRE